MNTKNRKKYFFKELIKFILIGVIFYIGVLFENNFLLQGTILLFYFYILYLIIKNNNIIMFLFFISLFTFLYGRIVLLPFIFFD